MALANEPSALRDFRKPSISATPIGRPRKSGRLNMFYGYPAKFIAE